MEIYEAVKSIAEEKKMSIAEVERLAGIANGTIGKWNKGQKPTLDSILKVCRALEVDFSSVIS